MIVYNIKNVEISADGSSGLKSEKDRYHLYVSYACPWASRTLMVRALKGLEDVISVNVVDYFLNIFSVNQELENYVGWTFTNTVGKSFIQKLCQIFSLTKTILSRHVIFIP